ncbi:MAG: hypothetical protein KDE27_02995 [Planctomycetes bacterium]|nr:hypothetical protein [Planctomycetota bacterium]
MTREPDDIDDNDLRDAQREEQVEMMKEWFLARYEDPVHHLPYDSEEGGYVWWLVGGSHDATDALSERFDDIVPPNVIEAAADDLSSDCADWVCKAELDDMYDDYQSDAIDADTHPLGTLRGALTKTEALVTRLDDDYLRSLALVGVVSALEAFLLDTFAGNVLGDEDLLRRYVEGEPEFRERKLDLPNLFKRREGLRDEVKEHLMKMLWHNVGKAASMYRWTFKIQIPAGLDVIGPAVRKRHDIVHRGGKTPDGDLSSVAKAELTTLIEAVEKFAIELDARISPF